jgi:Tol biopolymer transport system component
MRRLCIAALTCALAAPAAAHATFPGGNGRIALDLHGKNLDDAGQASYRSITTLKPDSRGDRFVRECQITGAGVRMGDCAIDYRSPSWSPSGRRLAFDAGASLALMNADGTGFNLLAPFTAGDGEPAWSRSGRQLAFTGAGGIWVADPVTRKLKRIVRRGSGPDWSSRNLIAFERGGSVYSVKPSGRGVRRIARGKDPGWAPSGRSLVLIRRNGIYTVRADGKNLRRIVRCPRCSTPVLSPNGKLVAYDQSGVRVARVSDGRREATLIEDLGSGTDAVDASNPSWQSR